MIRRLIAVLAVIAVALPTSALAHWRFTQWGMTPAQVKAAARGSLRDDGGGPRDTVMGQNRKLSGVLWINWRRYQAEFYFSDADHLTLVRLKPRKARDCGRVIAEMKAHYGPSDDAHHGVWTDPNTGDGVTQSFSEQHAYCYATYRKPGLPIG